MSAGQLEVHLVIVVDEQGYDRYAIFSSADKASAWAKTQIAPCIISPYVIDEPDYGDAIVH